MFGSLQKSHIMLAEFTGGFAVDLKDAKGGTIALQNDIHRTANSMFD